MNRVKMLASEPCQVPSVEADEAVAVVQIIDVRGREVLNLDLFVDCELKGRYFADKTENAFVSYVFGDDKGWTYARINNVARMCQGLETIGGEYYYYGSSEWHYATKQDAHLAEKYMGTEIMWWETRVMNEKKMTAYDRKLKRIADMMSDVPCVPDAAYQWVKDEIFPGNILFVKTEEGRDNYSCTACGHSSWKKAKKTGWKHNKQTVCPKCGQVVTVNKRQRERKRSECVIILQSMGDKEWIERQFRAVCRWAAGEEKNVELYEDVRAIIPKGETWGKVWRGNLSDADEFEQEWNDKNPLNKIFRKSYLWPGNLREVLPNVGDFVERSGIDILARKKVKIDVNKFITTFGSRPYVEYLIKAGLYRLVVDIIETWGWWSETDGVIYKGATKLTEALNLDGNRTNRMRQLNGGYNTLQWLQHEQATGRKISQASLEYLNQQRVTPGTCEGILKVIGSVDRMVNYMKRQRISAEQVINLWRDYLRMAEEEGYDITDDIVRLPRDLKARHDALVETINERRDAETRRKNAKKYADLDKRIVKHIPEAAIYYWQDQNYMIVPAAKCEELQEEGRVLHHCVGSSTSYMEKMAEGKTWICFLRRKNEIEKPWYTLEINMKTDAILQYYTKFNRKTDKEEVDKVLKKFNAHVKAQRMRQNDSSEEIMAIA